MQNIDTYIANVIETEGGYSNNPLDKGGETNHRITIKVARANGYNGPIAGMTTNEAATIYKSQYWINPKFDKIFDIDNQLSFMLFQFGVLAGTTTASKMLQRALNSLIKQPELVLPIDGVIGNHTIQMLSIIVSQHIKGESIKVIRGMVMAQQSVYLIECAERNINDKQFEYGWQLNRIIAVGFQ